MARTKKDHKSKRLPLILSRIAKKLKWHRNEQGFSLEELADLTGLSISTISEVENSKVSDLKLSTIIALSEGLSLDELQLMVQSNFSLSEDDQKAFRRAVKILNQIDGRLD